METGTRIEVNDDMISGGYIGYNSAGQSIITGQWNRSIKHGEGIVAKFVVARDVWDILKAIANPDQDRTAAQAAVDTPVSLFGTL
jgi:hypothetical protein